MIIINGSELTKQEVMIIVNALLGLKAITPNNHFELKEHIQILIDLIND
jgi:hypothetical protein